ncbi:MAG: hypothetical protein KJ626_16765 [Verrucomicrobia bacterium]|nr:hypothetical protein [Verrucomicrobiota bacterium]
MAVKRSIKAGKRELRVVPHSHFDLIWRRPVRWYRERRRQIYLRALDLLSGDSDFRYTFCQAMAVREFLEDEPREIRRMRKFIDEGRLEVVGCPMTIPDMNLTSGEAFVRNQMEGLRWLHATLDAECEIALLEDAFGVPATLPQILSLCGFRYYRASRMPRSDRLPPKGPYLWRGLDGTQIPTVGPAGMAWGFGASPNIDDPPHDYAQKVRQFISDLSACERRERNPGFFYLLGEEHILDDESLSAFREAAGALDIKITWSTFAEHFRMLQRAKAWEDAPVEKDDFSRLFTGCYTTRIEQKHLVARMEALLIARANLEAVTGAEAKDSRALWDQLFLLQFHDALGGCHTPENARYIETSARKALRGLRGAGPEAVNPLPCARSIPFVCDAFREVQKGAAEPAQDLDGDLVGCSEWVPFEGRSAVVKRVTARRRKLTCLDGDGGRVRLSWKTKMPQIMYEGVTWNIPGSLHLREDVGTLWTEDYTGREWCESAADSTLRFVETGSVFSRAVWEGRLDFDERLWPGFSSLSWRKSVLLFPGHSCVWVRYRLDWRGNSTEISWAIGSEAADSLKYYGSAPFGYVKRMGYSRASNDMTGEVYPSPRWASFGNSAGYWTVLHRGNPAFRVVRGGLENVLLRSPVKRWTPPFPVQPDPTAWDNGVHTFDYLLVPGRRFDPAEAARQSWAWQTPPQKAPHIVLDKNLLRILSSFPASLVVTSLEKCAEGWRLRLYEAAGKSAAWLKPESVSAIKQDFHGRIIAKGRERIPFEPFEVCDLMVQWGRS